MFFTEGRRCSNMFEFYDSFLHIIYPTRPLSTTSKLESTYARFVSWSFIKMLSFKLTEEEFDARIIY